MYRMNTLHCKRSIHYFIQDDLCDLNNYSQLEILFTRSTFCPRPQLSSSGYLPRWMPTNTPDCHKPYPRHAHFLLIMLVLCPVLEHLWQAWCHQGNLWAVFLQVFILCNYIIKVTPSHSLCKNIFYQRLGRGWLSLQIHQHKISSLR